MRAILPGPLTVHYLQGLAATSAHCGDSIEGLEAAQLSQDLAKAHALGNALVVALTVPWGLCFIFYSGGLSNRLLLPARQ